jgi:anaerobic selenocysteine-containing dehydrogenase
VLADLLQHPERIYRPAGAAPGRPVADAVREILQPWLANRPPDARMDIWLDGNVAIEDLAAAHALCAALGERARLLVHLPPHELGAVEGLDASGVAQTSPDNWAQADAFVVIGNPFVSHPPSARYLMRWGGKRRETPVVAIDPTAGVTGNYASHTLVCRPGGEYWALAELLIAAGFGDKTDWLPHVDLDRQIGKDSGVDMDRVHRAARQLRSARHPAVVIAPQSGSRQRWRALSAAAARWAERSGGTATVLTGHANALGTARFMRHRGLADWATGMGDGREPPDLLWVIGWDPASAYPRSAWAPDGKPARTVILAAAFPASQSDWVDVQLPLALGAEVPGTYALADGYPICTTPVMPPPNGVLSIRELVDEMGRALDESVARAGDFSPSDLAAASTLPEVQIPSSPEQISGEGMVVILTADAMQYFDGAMTGRSRWAAASDLLPELRISARDAESAGVSDGEVARICNDRGCVAVRVIVADRQIDAAACYDESPARDSASGWGAVSGGFSAVRRLADWRAGLTDPAAEAGVLRVRLQTLERTGQEELSHAHA